MFHSPNFHNYIIIDNKKIEFTKKTCLAFIFFSCFDFILFNIYSKSFLCRFFEQAARGGAEATTEMRAKAGRASYTSEAHLTQPDPGAYAIALVFEAIDKAYNSKK